MLDRIRDNRNHMAQMAIALGRGEPADKVLAERVPAIRGNLEQIAGLWRDYTAKDRLPDQLALIHAFDTSSASCFTMAWNPRWRWRDSGKSDALNQLFKKRLPPMFQAVFDADRDLVARQVQVGHDPISRRSPTCAGADPGACLAAAGLCAVFATGWALYASIRRPLDRLRNHLHAVTRSEWDREIVTPTVREFRGVFGMLRAMRAHLVFAEWQRREFENKAEQIRRETVDAMANRIEDRSGGAVERVGARARVMREEAGQMTASIQRVNHERRAHRGRRRSGVEKRPDCRLRQRATRGLDPGGVGPGGSCQRGGAGCVGKGGRRAGDHSLAGHGRRPDQFGGAADRRDRQPDQPAGAERDDRGGPRR